MAANIYEPENHDTLEGEYLDVVRIQGKIAEVTAKAGDGSFIGFGESMEILSEQLTVESRDFETKKAAKIALDLIPQQVLFGRVSL